MAGIDGIPCSRNKPILIPIYEQKMTTFFFTNQFHKFFFIVIENYQPWIEDKKLGSNLSGNEALL